ncbi:MAG: M1 family peptidase, partial [Flavobacteriaceae bacterium]|nr:M1 family peptidase [Flavobacteriaceae bacterium]
MLHKKIVLIVLGFFVSFVGFSQNAKERNQENINVNKFRQLYQEFSSPNMFRTASGAPGPAYYQQQADYKMDIELDDENKRIYGSETITYTNNSPDNLEYLWVQLDQNIRKKDSPSLLIDGGGVSPAYLPSGFTKEFLTDSFDGGFNIEYVVDENNKPLKHFVNQTMMRVDLPNILKSGESFSFSIKWWYNIQDHVNQDGRSGYESFDKDGNRVYIIAQFFPRMAVYNEVEGWQNYQFWGDGEFALPFGNYDVKITVP